MGRDVAVYSEKCSNESRGGQKRAKVFNQSLKRKQAREVQDCDKNQSTIPRKQAIEFIPMFGRGEVKIEFLCEG